VIVSQCAGTPPVDSGGAGIDDGGLGAPPGTIPSLPSPQAPERSPAEMLSSGYLERLGFHYKPATPATMYRHPSKLGMRA
jgi:hypothetical protein